MMLVVMEEHLERGGTCIALTIGKSGIIVTPGKQWFISPSLPVPHVNVTNDAMWL